MRTLFSKKKKKRKKKQEQLQQQLVVDQQLAEQKEQHEARRRAENQAMLKRKENVIRTIFKFFKDFGLAGAFLFLDRDGDVHQRFRSEFNS